MHYEIQVKESQLYFKQLIFCKHWLFLWFSCSKSIWALRWFLFHRSLHSSYWSLRLNRLRPYARTFFFNIQQFNRTCFVVIIVFAFYLRHAFFYLESDFLRIVDIKISACDRSVDLLHLNRRIICDSRLQLSCGLFLNQSWNIKISNLRLMLRKLTSVWSASTKHLWALLILVMKFDPSLMGICFQIFLWSTFAVNFSFWHSSWTGDLAVGLWEYLFIIHR